MILAGKEWGWDVFLHYLLNSISLLLAGLVAGLIIAAYTYQHNKKLLTANRIIEKSKRLRELAASYWGEGVYQAGKSRKDMNIEIEMALSINIYGRDFVENYLSREDTRKLYTLTFENYPKKNADPDFQKLKEVLMMLYDLESRLLEKI